MESSWIEISFAMDPDDYRLLRKKAETLGTTVPSLIRRNIERYLMDEAGEEIKR
jgi:hypothetical protein